MGLSSNQAQSQINNTVPALVSSGIASAVPPLISAAVAAIPQPQWIKITKSYTDFATAGLTNSINIYSLPAKGIIQSSFIYASTKASGGIIATYTLSIGVSGTNAKYCVAANVFTGASLPTPSLLTGVESMTGATNITATAISTVGLLNAASAGSFEIYMLISTLP